MSGRAAATEPLDDEAGGEGGGEGGRGKPKKAPNAFRTISEVADELHIPQHVLRFWETKFPQVKPLKRGGGRRYYRPDDITLLRRVSDLLYIQGYTIKGVQRLLREGGGRLSDDIPPAPLDERADGECDDALMAAEAEPQLPMPGLAPIAPANPAGAKRGAVRGAAKPVVDPGSDPALGDLVAEAARLRGLLGHTLRELEALRALLP